MLFVSLAFIIQKRCQNADLETLISIASVRITIRRMKRQNWSVSRSRSSLYIRIAINPFKREHVRMSGGMVIFVGHSDFEAGVQLQIEKISITRSRLENK